jgi:hypothetical protein
MDILAIFALKSARLFLKNGPILWLFIDLNLCKMPIPKFLFF